MRILHLLQYLALRIGLSLNPSKCQLLAIHGFLPVSLSACISPLQACTCEHCAPAIGQPVNYEALLPPLTPLPSAKYLGSYITPTSSPTPDIIFRCSQASTAFKQLEPFLRHPLVSPSINFGLTLPLFNPSFYTEWNLKPSPRHKLPKSIHFIIKLSAKSFILKVLTIIGYYNPPMPAVLMSIFSLSPTKFCHRLYQISIEFQTSVLNILGILSDTPSPMNIP